MTARIVTSVKLLTEEESEFHVGNSEALVLRLTSNLDSALGHVSPLAFPPEVLEELFNEIQRFAEERRGLVRVSRKW